jgi:DNA-binding GntR family transcriptional regulator
MVLPVKRINLRKRLVRSLFQAIIKGEFKPGDRMLEGPLARQLGVAQSTLREALQDLEHQGLVTKYDNRGTFVTDISLEEIDQLYAVRKQLEPFAASLARVRMTSAAFNELSNLLNRMHAAAEKHDFMELSLVDLEFHQLIWHLSGNRWLERALKLVGPPLLAFDYIAFYGSPIYDFERAYNQHRDLLNALNTGTSEDAGKFFEHMLEVFRAQDIGNLHALHLNSREAPALPKPRGAGKLRREPVSSHRRS